MDLSSNPDCGAEKKNQIPENEVLRAVRTPGSPVAISLSLKDLVGAIYFNPRGLVLGEVLTV
jgi:hypothetical protein